MWRAALVFVCVLANTAHAGDDLAAHTIVFTRGTSLIKSDARGRNETELVKLPGPGTVRALRTDAAGKILLADIDGWWWWMRLDGSARSLAKLPCEPGPAQMSQSGKFVLCRGKSGSLVFNVRTGKITPLPVPAAGARLTGMGADLRLVWADAAGIWSAVPPHRRQPRKVAPQPPLRSLLPSPDGTRAVGVYPGEVFENAHAKKQADMLMVFALDGIAARRKTFQNGVPVEWSHDSRWVLIQDGASACIMLAVGGQYKCWRGYTAQAIAPDGSYALVLGSRRADTDEDQSSKRDKKSSKKSKDKSDRKSKGKSKNKSKSKKSKSDRKSKRNAADEQKDREPSELPGDAHGDDPAATDDVPVPPPHGTRSLYRAELSGAYTKPPVLVARDVDGAAVWLPPAR